ncbi:flagellar filament capping protein FliD [Pseudoprimorskyibacter insulae]|uniref:Flagellar hook-associated protein 2 n=1 Tax=Pseudoprimorskyibacter insulae TaxID=1695997 RepID=A0A2R8AVP0_9RHOB|nr:flagellar filament capping protein FliD [Pseudoprimorskyibacter insulae]SPF80102.1 Flagellar hook-associated protein 2 [Pseudoprimorskyibacter insulae]
MAVDILSSLNTGGTGINLADLASDLTNAEFAPKRNIINNRIDKAEVSISGLDRLRGQLDELSGTMANLSSYETMSATTDDPAVSVLLTDPKKAPTIPSSVEVIQTAKTQVLEFAGFTSADQELGGGPLTINFGEWAGDPPVFTENPDLPGKTVTFQAGSTLADMAEALNMIDGVTARVLDVGDGTFSLGVISETGTKQALRFTAGPGADPGIAQLDFSADPTPFQVRGASDAIVAVDGIAVLRPSNEIDDLIPGMTLTLNGETDFPATVGVQSDPDMALSLMQSFVETYNSTRTAVKELSNRGFVEGETAGALAGDMVASTVMNSLSRVLSGGMSGFGDDPIYLSQLGIQTQRDGSLYLNTSMFEEVMTDDPVLFESVMRDSLRSTEPGVTLSGMPAGGGAPGRLSFDRDPATGIATLNGTIMTGTVLDDGRTEYAILKGEYAGFSITVEDTVESANIDYGKSMSSLLTDAIETALSGGGLISQREDSYNSTIAREQTALDELEDKAVAIETRYKAKFTAMETIVSQLNATGDYLTSLIDAWNAND